MTERRHETSWVRLEVWNYVHLAKTRSFCRDAVDVFFCIWPSATVQMCVTCFPIWGLMKLNHNRVLLAVLFSFIFSCTSAPLTFCFAGATSITAGSAHLFSGWQHSLISWPNQRGHPYFLWLLVWGRHLVVLGYLELPHLVYLQCCLNSGREVGFSTGPWMEKRFN